MNDRYIEIKHKDLQVHMVELLMVRFLTNLRKNQ